MRTIGLHANVHVSGVELPSDPPPPPSEEMIAKSIAALRAEGYSEGTITRLLGVARDVMSRPNLQEILGELRGAKAIADSAPPPASNRYQRRRAAAQRASR